MSLHLERPVRQRVCPKTLCPVVDVHDALFATPNPTPVRVAYEQAKADWQCKWYAIGVRAPPSWDCPYCEGMDHRLAMLFQKRLLKFWAWKTRQPLARPPRHAEEMTSDVQGGLAGASSTSVSDVTTISDSDGENPLLSL